MIKAFLEFINGFRFNVCSIHDIISCFQHKDILMPMAVIMAVGFVFLRNNDDFVQTAGCAIVNRILHMAYIQLLDKNNFCFTNHSLPQSVVLVDSPLRERTFLATFERV